MSKIILCDVCKKQTPVEGSRHLEIEIEKHTTKIFWIIVKDETRRELDICKDCWKRIFYNIAGEL